MTSRKSSDRLKLATKIFAVLLISLVANSNAQSENVFNISSDWIMVSGVVMMIAFSILGIAYMVAKVFGLPEWEAWVREESVNVIFSAVLIILFAAFAGVLEGVSNELALDILTSSSGSELKYWNYIEKMSPDKGGGRWEELSTRGSCTYPCHFYIARAFLGSTYERYGEMLVASAKTLGGSVLLESSAMGFGFQFHIWILDIGIDVGFPLYAARAIFNNTLQTVVQGLLGIVTNIKQQEIIMAYLPGLAGIFFLTGILSRILWFLRKFGGLLVALAIGIYVIFPMIYVLGWYTVDRSITIFDENFLPGKELDPDLGGALGDVGGADTSVFFTEYDSIGRISRVGLLDVYGRAHIPALLIPLIAIFTTIGFVRQFSPMIGGDIEIAGLTRLI